MSPLAVPAVIAIIAIWLSVHSINYNERKYNKNNYNKNNNYNENNLPKSSNLNDEIKYYSNQVWFQNRRAKWRRQEKSESLRLGLTHFTQLPHRLGCGGSGLPVDPWLSPPLLSALPGFLSHSQTVYPSYLTPPLSLAPSNLTMSSLAAMGHHHHHQPHGPHGPHNLHVGPSSAHLHHQPPPQPSPQSTHHNVHLSHLSPHLARMSPQSLATSSPQMIALSAVAAGGSGTVASAGNTGNSTATLTMTTTLMSPPPPPTALQVNSPHQATSCVSPPSSSSTHLEHLPQNLTTNNQSSGEMMTSTTSPTPPSPSSSSKCASTSSSSSCSGPSSVANIDIVDVGRESPLVQGGVSTTTQSTDIRSNSIATLRIKAKEHLESINKGLAMV